MDLSLLGYDALQFDWQPNKYVTHHYYVPGHIFIITEQKHVSKAVET
jgi:hypothetical protein